MITTRCARPALGRLARTLPKGLPPIAPLRARRTLATVSDSRCADIEDRDIVIVGGGPVGLALAAALGGSKIVSATCSIALLEGGDLEKIARWSEPEGEFSNRVSSVTNENLAFLKKIGAWEHVDASRTNPMERMEVWDGLSSARITFDAADAARRSPASAPEPPHMARFVENLHLQRALLSKLSSLPVSLLSSSRVEGIAPCPSTSWPVLSLSSGRRLRARLLVGADGFNSPVKNYSQIGSHGWKYDAECVVGSLEVEPTGVNYTAWQRFLTSGPLGFLPLNDSTASLAWSTKPRIASALKKLDSPALAALINASFALPHNSVSYLLSLVASPSPPSSSSLLSEIEWRYRPEVTPPEALPPAHHVPPRVLAVRKPTVASFPLKMFHADSYLGDSIAWPSDGPELGATSSRGSAKVPRRTALLGDAAHVIHPMAGQGLNLGLGDAKVLAEVVASAVDNGLDIGTWTALAPYPRRRYALNHAVLSTVDKLHKLYSVTSPPVVWARSVGVEVLQELPFLKAALMGSAGAEEGARGSGLDDWEPGSGRGVGGLLGAGVDGFSKAMEAGGVIGGAVKGVAGSMVGLLAQKFDQR